LQGWLDYCVNDKDLKNKQKELEKDEPQREPDAGKEPVAELRPEGDKQFEKDVAEEKTPQPEKDGNKERADEGESKREKTFFTADREGLTKSEARNLIEANFGTRVAYHQMILSSGDKDVDPHEYARSQMESLKKILGHDFVWVGNVHADTGEDKKHINITMGGRIPDFEPYRAKLQYEGSEIDINRVDDNDKFRSEDGTWLSKFHPVDDLQKFADSLQTSKQWLPADAHKNLWKWIGNKNYHGDDYYGTPPLKDIDKERELGGYKPKEIDYDKIPESDKFAIGDMPITKYDPVWQLEHVREQQTLRPLDLGEANNSKLDKLIADKNKFGDQVYGSPPRINDEPARNSNDPKVGIDLSKIPEKEQIKLCGQNYTKYDDLESLKRLAAQGRKDPEWRLTGQQYKQLQNWIATKQRSGNDVYGEPPTKPLAEGERDARDKSFVNFQFELGNCLNDVDRMAHELTRGKQISPQGAKFKSAIEKAAKRIEGAFKQSNLKSSWNNRGDVYLDVDSLNALRAAGNYDVHVRGHLDRELEKAIERELGHDREERDRPLIRGFGNPKKIADRLKSMGAVFGVKAKDNKEPEKDVASQRQEREAEIERTEQQQHQQNDQQQKTDTPAREPEPEKGRTEKSEDEKNRDKGDDDFKKGRR
jgi:hypothetical protein